MVWRRWLGFVWRRWLRQSRLRRFAMAVVAVAVVNFVGVHIESERRLTPMRAKIAEFQQFVPVPLVLRSQVPWSQLCFQACPAVRYTADITTGTVDMSNFERRVTRPDWLYGDRCKPWSSNPGESCVLAWREDGLCITVEYLMPGSTPSAGPARDAMNGPVLQHPQLRIDIDSATCTH